MRRAWSLVLAFATSCASLYVANEPAGEGYVEKTKPSGATTFISVAVIAAAVVGLLWIAERPVRQPSTGGPSRVPR